jgi:hypothetical protein
MTSSCGADPTEKVVGAKMREGMDHNESRKCVPPCLPQENLSGKGGPPRKLFTLLNLLHIQPAMHGHVALVRADCI